MTNFQEIMNKFQVNGEVTDVHPLGHGHVNHTFEVVCGGEHYVVQEINHILFKYPVEVVNNQFLVTEYLRGKIAADGGEPNRETLTFLRTKDENQLLQTEDGAYYRVYRMIEQGIEATKPASREEVYEAAAVVGLFQHRLIGFDETQLSYTFPRMHDMHKCIRRLLDALRADICSRTADCQEQIRFVLDRSEQLHEISAGLESGKIPRRVAHNDAGYTNVLVDEKTGKAICMLDLDTVMPGSSLYDFGELVRAGAATVTEYDKTGDVELNLDFYRATLEGYLKYMGHHLTTREKELLSYSVWLMAMEKGINFLTDYLEGDRNIYDFSEEKQNLYAAVNQFYLVLDIEDKMEQMQEIVTEVQMSL